MCVCVGGGGGIFVAFFFFFVRFFVLFGVFMLLLLSFIRGEGYGFYDCIHEVSELFAFRYIKLLYILCLY